MNDSLSDAVETALGASQPEATGQQHDAAKPHRKKRVDHHLWGTYILLTLVALIELFSASIQEVSSNEIFGPIIRHGRFIAAGLVLMLILQAIHYRIVYRFIPLFVFGCFGLMLAVKFGGHSINGAVRAIEIGGVPILPAEFMKLGAAMGMAYILTKTQLENKRDVSWGGAVAAVIFMIACCWLLFEHGLSNTIVVVAICFSMMLVGGMGLKKFGIILLFFGLVGGVAIKVKTSVKENVELTDTQRQALILNHESTDVSAASGRGETWRNRIARHFRSDKFNDTLGPDNQQELLSYVAQAHGGIIGVGPGKSRENARLPLAFSDYVFAIIVEEGGLLGGLAILAVYMWILGRSAKLTVSFRHTMPGTLVMGCAFVIVFQALFHMAIVTGVVPVSGQPLPLISKGGISVLATSLAFGIMLSVSRHAARVSDSKAAQRSEMEILPENARSVNPVMSGNVE